MNDTRRVLGPFDATMVVAGAIVGVGIFAMPGEVAAKLPDRDWILLAWGVGGVIAALGALTFASLARRVPRAGGTYAFLREAFGPLPAFLFGWASLLTINTGAMAFMATMVSLNIALCFGGDPGGVEGTVVAIVVILLLTAVNALGVRQGAWTQNAVTVIKLLSLLALILLGWLSPVQESVGARRVEAAGSLTLPAFCFGILPVLFSYGGWQNACNLAEQVRRPRRDVPFAIVVGTIGAALIYLAINAALVHQLGVEGTASATPIAGVALGVATLGEAGSRIINVAIALSAFGVLNGFILGTPWILFAMARDGCFFRAFARVGARSGAPLSVLGLQAALAIAYLLVGELYDIVEGLVVIDWLFFSLAGFACVKLLARGPAARRVVPGVFAALSLGIVSIVVTESIVSDTRTAPMALVQLVVLGFGVGAYFLFFSSSTPAGGSDPDGGCG